MCLVEDRRQGIDHIFIFSEPRLFIAETLLFEPQDQGFIVNFTHTFPSWRAARCFFFACR